MKTLIKKIVRNLATKPIIGRPIRIAVAVVHLPEFKDTCSRTVLDLSHRQQMLEGQQLPNVVEMVSQFNNYSNDHENLIRSMPAALRLMTRTLRDLDQRMTQTRAQCVQIEAVKESLEQRLANTEQQLQGLDYLMKRVEFVRRELMFEMRYGGSSCDGMNDQLQPEIVTPQKLTSARAEGLRLNLGCGHIALDGYINIDRRPLPGVDIVAEVSNLPLNHGEADEVFSSHLLEHFPQEQLRRELLPYWVNLLKPGGIFRAVVPDTDSMIGQYSNGEFPYEHLREVTFGAQDYNGDFHYNMFVPSQMEELTAEAGLSHFEVVARGRPNGNCLEMEIKALKQ